MSNGRDALLIAQKLDVYNSGKVEEQTQNCLRTKKMICSSAPNGTTIGVSEAFGGSFEMQIPYYSAVSDAQVGDVVRIEYEYNDMSTAKARSISSMLGGNVWDKEAAGLKSRIVDIVYPVGSIYCTTTSANPGTLFGGSWSGLTSPSTDYYVWERDS